MGSDTFCTSLAGRYVRYLHKWINGYISTLATFVSIKTHVPLTVIAGSALITLRSDSVMEALATGVQIIWMTSCGVSVAVAGDALEGAASCSIVHPDMTEGAFFAGQARVRRRADALLDTPRTLTSQHTLRADVQFSFV